MMLPTTNFDFGEIILVPFPFTNLQTHKQRPAVVISTVAYQQQQQDVILMAITSNRQLPASFGDHVIRDWQTTGLLKPSVLKPLIATVEASLVLKSLGHMSARDVEGLEVVLDNILGA